MKQKLIILLAVILVASMVAPAFAKSNATTMTARTSGFLAMGYWEAFDTDGEFCWGNYKEVYIRDMDPRSDTVELTVFMYEYRYPCGEEKPEMMINEEPPTEPEWTEYFKIFNVPRSDFIVGKKLESGAVLDTMTEDGHIHLVWTIEETNYERAKNSYKTEGISYSFRANSKYGTGYVDGHIFDEETGPSNYGAMGHISSFERTRMTN
jgi:hypothetical protein